MIKLQKECMKDYVAAKLYQFFSLLLTKVPREVPTQELLYGELI